MRKKIIKIVPILIAFFLILTGINVDAHQGKTDSSGGHKDKYNKSGLGSYHYHCGGHPAHLHTNGVCPYSSSSTPSTSSSKTSSSTSSSEQSTHSNKTTITTPETIDVKQTQRLENKIIVKTSTSDKNNIDKDTTSEEVNPLGGILTLGLLGGGFLGYKKYKK